MGEIDWRDIKIGEKYKLEDKYYFQADVTILEDVTLEERPVFKRYKFKIDKLYTDITKRYKEGDIEIFGRIVEGEGLYLVSGMKFKPLDGMFDYCTLNYNPFKQ